MLQLRCRLGSWRSNSVRPNSWHKTPHHHRAGLRRKNGGQEVSGCRPSLRWTRIALIQFQISATRRRASTQRGNLGFSSQTNIHCAISSF